MLFIASSFAFASAICAGESEIPISCNMAMVLLFESLKPTYLIPNSTEEKIREILQEGVKGESPDKGSVEIKYRLVAENTVRSKVNERSNIL